MKKTIGIDLGTTNSVVAFKTRDVEILRNRENEELTRSCVALRNDEILVGRHAFNLLGADPANTILSVKRLMGGAISDPMVQQMRANKDYYRFGIVPLEGGTDDAVAVVLGGKQYTPEQISAEILKKLKADAEEKLGGEVTHAVITVPAYFTEKQKNATRLAASYAGLKVLQLLAEPTAAAIAYGVDTLKAGELQTVVVYDFGGGTFDLSILSILDRDFSEMGAGGDRWLGGDNLDQALQAYIFQKVEKQYNLESLQALIDVLPDRKRNKVKALFRIESERIKIDLSSMQSQSLLHDDLLEDENGNAIDIELTITKAELEQVIRPLIERTVTLTEALLAQMSYTPHMIDAFLLVGGSSCIPLVKQLMSEHFGANKVRVGRSPMLAIAEGAAMLAQSMGDTYECPNCGAAVPQAASNCPSCGYDVATEVKERGVAGVTLTSKHDLFIMLTDRTTGEALPEKLFSKQMPLPDSASRNFRTAADQQRLMKVEIKSDVENGQMERQTFGFVTIDENFPAGSELVFDFTLSENEIMECRVHPKGFSNQAKTVILERGNKDGKALQDIDKLITDFNASGYNTRQRTEFTEALVQQLKLADTIGNDKSQDPRWPELGYKTSADFDRITQKEESDPADMNVFFAQLLCDNYPQLLGVAEVNQLRSLVARAKLSDFEGLQAKTQLDELVNNYGVLTHLYFLKFAGRLATEKGSPDGNRLRALHDQAVAYFEQGDRDEAYRIMAEAEPLADKYVDSDTGKPIETRIWN